MKRKINYWAIFGVMVLLSSSAFADEKIIIERQGLNEQYSTDGGETFQPLDEFNMGALRATLNTNPRSMEELQKYDAVNLIVYPLAFIGGVGLGWPLSVMLNGDEWSTTETIFLSVGVAGLIGAFIFEGIAINHFNRAVDIYNGDIAAGLKRPNHQFIMGFSDENFLAGVNYRF